MASFTLSSHPSLIKPFHWRGTRQILQVRAQKCRDEGRSKNDIVEANMSVLTARIEEVRIKERLERCCRCDYGWNYAPEYNSKLKREKEVAEFLDLVGLVCGTVGFTWLGGSLFLCLVSLIVHLNQ
ncbi:hypothetical protein Tsubulata_003960 [Turnera subulata]|uniref:Uncharacterized protein n=1 Tax=Turnera subulata TaxID=218843 RepID=A0A9Q0GC67_9ROSI|nr:hypothetical protein Tsubulata_003960 [Turnera subulata]